TNQFQWTDTLNWTKGGHQIRVGIDARMPMRNIYLDVPAMRGRLSFDGQRTSNGTSNTGVGLADFLLGYPQSAELATASVTDARLWMLSEFLQDDYKLTPNTVIRSGYGRFYALLERAGSEDQMFLNPPWLVDKSVSATSASTTVNNMRVATGFNLSLDPSTVNLTQVRLRAVNPNNV